MFDTGLPAQPDEENGERALMRSVRVQRILDLIARFPRAHTRLLDERLGTSTDDDGARSLPGLQPAGTVRIGGEDREAFLEHPDRCVVFRNVALPRGARLEAGYGVLEGAWEKPGDGVRFRVSLGPEGRPPVTLLDHYVNPKARREHRRWFDLRADLSRWGGRPADLYFETDGGPAGNTDYDWAVWSAPRVTGDDGIVTYDVLERFDDLTIHRRAGTEVLRLDEVSIGDDLRSVIFQHPPSVIRYPSLPIHPGARLTFGVGVHPAVWDKPGDGVDFEIWVEIGETRRQIFHRALDPKASPEDRRWFDEVVDLDAWAGSEIALELIVGPGPAGDARHDWALWSSPQIESRGRETRLAGDDDASVLLVTLDTTRADHLGCDGDSPARTPHLDRLARRGLRFSRTWCQSNITIPSHLAILSGRLPHRHVLDNRRHRLPESLQLLPQLFSREGYRTFAATGVHILGPSWTQGIDRGVDDFDAVSKYRRSGERTVSVFREWLEAHHHEPFFAWVHLFDPHAPYRPTREYDRMYYRGDERDPAGPGLGAELPPFLEEIRAWLQGVTDPAFPPAQYAAQITHTDALVGGLLGALEDLGLTSRTVVAVTADHGESLGEHGVHFNHVGLFEEVARVPMLLALPPRWAARGGHPVAARSLRHPWTWRPGPMLQGRSISSPVMTVDLAPTLLELVGLGVPAGLDGRSLLPLVRGETKRQHDHIVVEHTDLAQVAVVRDGWKYLRAEADLEYTGSFSLRAGEESLHDLSRPDGESGDAAASEPGRLATMRLLADRVLRERAGEVAADLEMDDAMRQRLRDLGYL